LQFNNLFSWFANQNQVTPDTIDEAIRNGILGGFKANLSLNYMKSLLNILPPEFKGLGGFTFNANIKYTYDDIEEILEHPVLSSVKGAAGGILSVDQVKQCMDLDLSDGLTSAFGIPKELCDQFL
jgi:hypothetical protein